MTGTCTSCKGEVEAVFDEYGAPVCPNCDDDVHVSVHVEEEEEFTDADFDEWLLNG